MSEILDIAHDMARDLLKAGGTRSAGGRKCLRGRGNGKWNAGSLADRKLLPRHGPTRSTLWVTL